MSKENADWSNAFGVLAYALLKYSKAKSAPGEELFRLLKSDSEFTSENSWLSRFDASNAPALDPISLFASLSDPTLKDISKTRRLNQYLRILGQSEHYKEVNYLGCPTPITKRIISLRNPEAQKEIWLLFFRSQNYKLSLEKKVFSQIKNWYGIDVASLTIFLFWVKPKYFLPLDRNTVQYLLLNQHIVKHPKSYEDYRFILDLPLGDYLKLSVKVYRQSRFGESMANASAENVQEVSLRRRTTVRRQHRILAIKFHKKMEEFPDLIKTLETEKIYRFYQSYEFSQDMILYDSQKDISLYSQNGMEISISAIVGKNGSGKSTLTELLYAAINNLSQKHPSVKKKEIQYVPNLYLEFYYLTTFLYRIEIDGEKVSIYRYSSEGITYVYPEEVKIENFELEEFFYTLAINYAHYGLNSKHLGKWLYHIFHKNDGYQMPITISPYRKDGNIDINSEMDLVRSRLLSLVLQPVNDLGSKNDQENLRTLKKGHVASSLKIIMDTSKTEILYEKLVARKNSKDIYEPRYLREAAPYWKGVLKIVCAIFDIAEERIPTLRTNKKTADYYAFAYIVKKLISITINYPEKYGKYFNRELNRFNETAKFIEDLYKNYSHITFKLRQAINFIKFDHIRKHFDGAEIFMGKSILIDILSNDIETIIAQGKNKDLKIAYLAPPPFLKTDIIFANESSFDQLSSGEKQRVYSVTTLVYHLLNLESVPVQTGTVSYTCVNVLFDEVELYFHPEMQRTFISFMLNYLRQAQLADSINLNICFITHSPFILSDIPSNNILFLDQGFSNNLDDFFSHFLRPWKLCFNLSFM